MFKRILVASDLTVLSEPALRLAASLAKDNLASGVVLNVAEDPEKARRWLAPLPADEVAHLRAFRTRQEAATLELLADQVHAAEATFDCLVRWGDPAETIAAEAAARGADLVIVGSRGPLLGSVAERVLRIADRPVLVVPGVPPGHPRLGVRRA